MSPTPDKNGGRACHRFAEHEDLEVEHMMSLHLFHTCCWKIAGDLQDNHRPCMRGSVANPVSLKGRWWSSFVYSSLVALKLIHMFTLPRNGLIEPCALWRKVAYFWISFSALTPYKANSSQYSFYRITRPRPRSGNRESNVSRETSRLLSLRPPYTYIKLPLS